MGSIFFTFLAQRTSSRSLPTPPSHTIPCRASLSYVQPHEFFLFQEAFEFPNPFKTPPLLPRLFLFHEHLVSRLWILSPPNDTPRQKNLIIILFYPYMVSFYCRKIVIPNDLICTLKTHFLASYHSQIIIKVLIGYAT